MASRRVKGPCYPLDRELLRRAILGKKKALRPVAECLGLAAPRAASFIRAALLKLTDADYVETREMDYDEGPIVADVYGYFDGQRGWYVKMYVDAAQYLVVSFHPPEYPLKCRNGRIIKAGT